MIRTKGEAGTGDVVEAVRHMRQVTREIRALTTMKPEELFAEAKRLGAPYELVAEVAKTGKLPVPNFAAGGIATPADASLMMQLGAETVFVGSGIFKVDLPDLDSDDSVKRAAAYQRSLDISRTRAKAIVEAVAHYADPVAVLAASKALDFKHSAMRGIQAGGLSEEQQMAPRGW